MRSWILFLIIALMPVVAAAESYELYSSPKTPAPNYAEILQRLRRGDVIQFGDGRKFELVDNPINSGMLDVLVQVKEGFALRIPKRFGDEVSVDHTYRGSRYLRSKGIDVVEVIEGAYHPGQYVGVEWVNFEIHYNDFIDRFDAIEPELRKKMLADLEKFAVSTWEFRNIGDLREDQVVYVRNRGWVILDLIDEYSAVSLANHGTIFTADSVEYMRNQYLLKKGEVLSSFGMKLRFPEPARGAQGLIDAIEAKRLENGLQFGFCRRLLHRVRSWFSP